MPEITIHLPSMLAEAVGIGSVSYRAATLGEAISLLKSHHPRIATHLFDDAGAQRRHVLLFLNDRDTRWLDNPDEPLADGDRLSIVQAISGG